MNKSSPLYWENWSKIIFYIPLSFVWGWYMLRSRAIWFFTPSNPSITFGGMDGEPKEEIYNRLPKHLYPPTFFVYPGTLIDRVLEQVKEHNIVFPLVVKPAMGKGGILFRRLLDAAELAIYHRHVDVAYIVQQFCYHPMEVSVYYIRKPGELTGVITGFLHKTPLAITGNGINTVAQLINDIPKARDNYDKLIKKYKHLENDVLPEGETLQLSYAANRTGGGKFVNLKHEITPALTEVFNRLSIEMKDWYFGRYDIMCNSIEELQRGENYTILEYNGVGAAPNHIYFSGYTLLQAYAEILYHWKMLFEICRRNRQLGVKVISGWEGFKFLRLTIQRLNHIEKLDRELPV